MPFYEYACAKCQRQFTELRSIAERDVAPACPECLEPTERVVSATPGVVKNPAVPKKNFR